MRAKRRTSRFDRHLTLVLSARPLKRPGILQTLAHAPCGQAVSSRPSPRNRSFPTMVISFSNRLDWPAGCRTRPPRTRSVRPWEGWQHGQATRHGNALAATAIPTEGMQKGMNYEENVLPEIAGNLGRRRRPTSRVPQIPAWDGKSRRNRQTRARSRKRRRDGLRNLSSQDWLLDDGRPRRPQNTGLRAKTEGEGFEPSMEEKTPITVFETERWSAVQAAFLALVLRLQARRFALGRIGECPREWTPTIRTSRRPTATS